MLPPRRLREVTRGREVAVVAVVATGAAPNGTADGIPGPAMKAPRHRFTVRSAAEAAEPKLLDQSAREPTHEDELDDLTWPCRLFCSFLSFAPANPI